MNNDISVYKKGGKVLKKKKKIIKIKANHRKAINSSTAAKNINSKNVSQKQIVNIIHPVRRSYRKAPSTLHKKVEDRIIYVPTSNGGLSQSHIEHLINSFKPQIKQPLNIQQMRDARLNNLTPPVNGPTNPPFNNPHINASSNPPSIYTPTIVMQDSVKSSIFPDSFMKKDRKDYINELYNYEYEYNFGENAETKYITNDMFEKMLKDVSTENIIKDIDEWQEKDSTNDTIKNDNSGLENLTAVSKKDERPDIFDNEIEPHSQEHLDEKFDTVQDYKEAEIKRGSKPYYIKMMVDKYGYTEDKIKNNTVKWMIKEIKERQKDANIISNKRKPKKPR